MPTPSAHHKMCQAQMEGMPNTHVAASFGLPKIVLPMTAPGPMPKKNQAIVMPQAQGIRGFLLSGSPA